MHREHASLATVLVTLTLLDTYGHAIHRELDQGIASLISHGSLSVAYGISPLSLSSCSAFNSIPPLPKQPFNPPNLCPTACSARSSLALEFPIRLDEKVPFTLGKDTVSLESASHRVVEPFPRPVSPIFI